MHFVYSSGVVWHFVKPDSQKPCFLLHMQGILQHIVMIHMSLARLTTRLRMQAAELAGQSAERLRLARAALCKRAPLRLRSPTDLLHTLRLEAGCTSGQDKLPLPV